MDDEEKKDFFVDTQTYDFGNRSLFNDTDKIEYGNKQSEIDPEIYESIKTDNYVTQEVDDPDEINHDEIKDTSYIEEGGDAKSETSELDNEEEEDDMPTLDNLEGTDIKEEENNNNTNITDQETRPKLNEENLKKIPTVESPKGKKNNNVEVGNLSNDANTNKEILNTDELKTNKNGKNEESVMEINLGNFFNKHEPNYGKTPASSSVNNSDIFEIKSVASHSIKSGQPGDNKITGPLNTDQSEYFTFNNGNKDAGNEIITRTSEKENNNNKVETPSNNTNTNKEMPNADELKTGNNEKLTAVINPNDQHKYLNKLTTTGLNNIKLPVSNSVNNAEEMPDTRKLESVVSHSDNLNQPGDDEITYLPNTNQPEYFTVKDKTESLDNGNSDTENKHGAGVREENNNVEEEIPNSTLTNKTTEKKITEEITNKTKIEDGFTDSKTGFNEINLDLEKKLSFFTETAEEDVPGLIVEPITAPGAAHIASVKKDVSGVKSASIIKEGKSPYTGAIKEIKVSRIKTEADKIADSDSDNKKWQDTVGARNASKVAETVMKKAFVELEKDEITYDDMNMFISVMKLAIQKEIYDKPSPDQKVGYEAGYSVWAKSGGVIEGILEQINEEDVKETLKKFNKISVQIQKSAAAYLDTIEGRNYSNNNEFGARSFRVVQMLNNDYKMSDEKSPSYI